MLTATSRRGNSLKLRIVCIESLQSRVHHWSQLGVSVKPGVCRSHECVVGSHLGVCRRSHLRVSHWSHLAVSHWSHLEVSHWSHLRWCRSHLGLSQSHLTLSNLSHLGLSLWVTEEWIIESLKIESFSFLWSHLDYTVNFCSHNEATGVHILPFSLYFQSPQCPSYLTSSDHDTQDGPAVYIAYVTVCSPSE